VGTQVARTNADDLRRKSLLLDQKGASAETDAGLGMLFYCREAKEKKWSKIFKGKQPNMKQVGGNAIEKKKGTLL